MQQNIYDHPDFFKGYKQLRQSPLNYNNFVEQPALRRMLPDLKGKHVLDLGCGMGEFARFCIEQGAAEVTGIDLSENMIAEARRHPSERITYVQGSIEDTPLGQYDLVVSSLALHYVKDYEGAVQKVAKALRPGGTFLFSVEHPIVTASKQGDWVKDEKGNKLYYPIDHYHEEGQRIISWYVDGVIIYHRTLTTLLNGLMRAGFTLQEIEEPIPTEEGIRLMPRVANELRKPSFLIIKAEVGR
ncbi:class I SAM-dependent methyltransferase [Ectobacillus antri]|jgi:SAM-dependent methyltransferase|uniref:Class I SAM-dependent methyltransferase n=1 Tax=Ectobacillus antri TaxID=2486280 RepID=A0ABT6H4X3_9BACI|nr:class I SAM-dependent methyltransferase [Ectobacillus antri]MDG4657530.1 class I SAM-dependent methyltransferase [Ectobacillus antri]MDG5753843.1 class I SAM-dependent methyltransferase [Ectobacillus antri]